MTDEPKCPACGIPYVEHPGLIATCLSRLELLHANERLQLRVEQCERELAKLATTLGAAQGGAEVDIFTLADRCGLLMREKLDKEAAP